ncbi:MAG TPA: rhomboid family intramembrane serine protease [Streptosporangiaceae bacterium]|jgi:membrane associated rhomboid family serine protease|nr:rhomboid family intramembrane serine protease [Streptosporangiaceae bacterium]
MSSSKHRAWTLGTEDAESLVAEARKALFVMVGILAVLWVVQLVNVADHYGLTQHYGIIPRDVHSLPYLLTAPFLHVSWTHIESNSGPLFIFGFLAAYRGVGRFLWLTGLVIVTSGLAAWLFGDRGTIAVGASGVVFGYLGYVLVKGFFDRHGIDIMIGAVMALCFAYQFTVLLPKTGIGYQAHIGGLVGGLAGGWILRDRSAARKAKARAVAAKKASPASAGTGTATALPASTGTATALPATTVPAGTPAGTGTARQQDHGTGVYPGPRADLHRQLDDMGL